MSDATQQNPSRSTTRTRFGRERIGRILAAESLAVVGASDRSAWSHMVVDNLREWDFQGRVHFVNRRGADAHGQSSSVSCAGIGEPVDVAILLVSNDATPAALQDAAAAGIGGAVVLGAGFGEAGEEGKRAELALAELARELDIALIGPNGVGYASLLDRVPAWVSPLPRPYLPGSVAVASQSGNLGLTIGHFAARHAVGVSHMVSTGNEVNVDIVDILDALVEDERVNVLAVFAETLRDPAGFLAVAERAAELAKPIVMLKAGASELAAAVAQTHTGALVGDDAVVDAALRSAGVIRVKTIEQLVVSAGLLAHTGALPPGGLGIVSISGGSDDIIADRAEELGLPLPELAPATRQQILKEVEELGVSSVMNPFDITGAAVGRYEALVGPLRAIGADPSIAIVAYTGVPFIESPPMIETYPYIAAGLQDVGRRGLLLVNCLEPIGPEQQQLLDGGGIPHTVTGIENGIVAIRDAIRWSAWLRERKERSKAGASPAIEADLDGEHTGVWAEARALDALAAHGVPVVPWRLARTAGEAAETANELGYPVVLKVAAPEIVHKSELGGVALDLPDEQAVREAFARVTAVAADVEGAIVAPMRASGTELIVGVVRDAQWGLVLAVGLGGVQAEALDDTALRLLPVAPADVRDMLLELRGRALLEGFRGAAAADLESLVASICSLAAFAVTVEPQLLSMEVNPLLIDGDSIEALDAVIEWRTVEEV